MLFSPREQACQNMWLIPLVFWARVNVRQPSVADWKKDRHIRVTDQRPDHILGTDRWTDFVVMGFNPMTDKTLSICKVCSDLVASQLEQCNTMHRNSHSQKYASKNHLMKKKALNFSCFEEDIVVIR